MQPNMEALFFPRHKKDSLEETTIKFKDADFFVGEQSKGTGTTNKDSSRIPLELHYGENIICPPALLIWAQKLQDEDSLFFPLLKKKSFPWVAAKLSSHYLQNNPLNEEGKGLFRAQWG